jgi:hypothetical protein
MSYQPEEGVTPCSAVTMKGIRGGRRFFRRPLFFHAATVVLFVLVLFAGCAGIPEEYRGSVESTIGKGDFLLVVQEPTAWNPAYKLIEQLLMSSGMEEKDIRQLMGRSRRLAFAVHGDSLRLAMEGTYPRFAVRAAARSMRDDNSVSIISPWKGIVLVSSGNHRWMDEVTGIDSNSQVRFRAGDMLPGQLAFFVSDPLITESFSAGFISNEARGSLAPVQRDGAEGFSVDIFLEEKNETAATRLVSTVRTVVFVITLDSTSLLQPLAREIVSERAVERQEAGVAVGPVFLDGELAGKLMEEWLTKKEEDL